jgi:hypothetical protein
MAYAWEGVAIMTPTTAMLTTANPTARTAAAAATYGLNAMIIHARLVPATFLARAPRPVPWQATVLTHAPGKPRLHIQYQIR